MSETPSIEITHDKYESLLAYARSFVNTIPFFPLSEHDLVHTALCEEEPDLQKAIKNIVFRARRENRAHIQYLGDHQTQTSPSKLMHKRFRKDKICSKCDNSLPPGYFSLVYDKRINLYYLSSVCILCKRADDIAYYEKVKDTPEYQARQQSYTPSKVKKNRARRRNKIKDTLLDGTKFCAHCKDDLPPRCFGLEYDKVKEKYFLSSSCLICRRKIKLKHYYKVKDTEPFKRKIKAKTKARWQKTKNNPKRHQGVCYQKRKNYAARMKDPAFKAKQLEHTRSNNKIHQQRMKEDPVYAEAYRAQRRISAANWRTKKKAEQKK